MAFKKSNSINQSQNLGTKMVLTVNYYNGKICRKKPTIKNYFKHTFFGDNNGANVSFRLSKRLPMPRKAFFDGLNKLSGLVRRRSVLLSFTASVTPFGNVV